MGNYSFLQFTYSGSKYNVGLNILISYLRFPLTFLPILALFMISKETRTRVFIFMMRNLDILIFIFFGFFSLINFPFFLNGYIYTALFSGSVILILLFLYFISEHQKDYEVLYNISKMLVVSHFVLIILALISILNYDFGARSAYQYFTLKFGDVLFFSNPLLVVAISLGFIYVIQSNKFYLKSVRILKLSKFRLLVTIFLFLFIGYLMFISNRRTPLILLGGAIPVILFLSVKSKFIKCLSFLVIPFALAYGVSLIPKFLEENRDQSKLLYRLERIKIEDGNISDASFEVRLVIWKSYFEDFKKNPILGIGQGNLAVVHAMFNKEDSFIAKKSPHNTFLGLLVTNGICGGLLLIFIMMRSFFIFFYRSKGIVKYYFLMFFGCVLIMNLLEFNLYPGQSLFWPSFIMLLFPRIYLNNYLIK